MTTTLTALLHRQESCARVEALLCRGQEPVLKARSLEGVALMVRTLKAYGSMY